jgi:hypothetical protein
MADMKNKVKDKIDQAADPGQGSNGKDCGQDNGGSQERRPKGEGCGTEDQRSRQLTAFLRSR